MNLDNKYHVVMIEGQAPEGTAMCINADSVYFESGCAIFMSHQRHERETVCSLASGTWLTVFLVEDGNPVVINTQNEGKWKCKNCIYWGREPLTPTNMPEGIDIRGCDLEPCDQITMKETDIAVLCGDDGGIYYGSEFGCNRFEPKDKP